MFILFEWGISYILELAAGDIQTKTFWSIMKFGGVICGEDGAGVSRSHLLRRQLGPLWPAMVEIKRVFDPDSVLNPGKVVSSRLPRADENLRAVKSRITLVPYELETAEVDAAVAGRVVGDNDDYLADGPGPQGFGVPVETQETTGPIKAIASLPLIQNWDGEDGLERAARLCNGCGRCLL